MLRDRFSARFIYLARQQSRGDIITVVNTGRRYRQDSGFDTEFIVGFKGQLWAPVRIVRHAIGMNDAGLAHLVRIARRQVMRVHIDFPIGIRNRSHDVPPQVDTMVTTWIRCPILCLSKSSSQSRLRSAPCLPATSNAVSHCHRTSADLSRKPGYSALPAEGD